VHVHKVVTAYLYGGQGALVAHTKDDSGAFFGEAGETPPLFASANWGKSDEDVLHAHWSGLASFARDHRDPLFVWNHGGSIAVKTTVIHDPQMSREDPQFKLRMPAELRAQAEQAAKASGRSLNSELVARIESSFLNEGSADRLISAARAKELALMARSGIPDEIRRRAVASIGKAIRLGHDEAFVVIDDLQLGVGIADEELDKLLNAVKNELEDAGYIVNCDDIEAIHLRF
jgi:hypothetical protein